MGLILTSLLLLFFLLNGCSNNNDIKISKLKSEIDSIKTNYRPELGEFMLDIQLHHAKIWFAGINQNWQLANYETDELKESFDDAAKIETNRIETKNFKMIYPMILKLKNDIASKNIDKFKQDFSALTNTCNDCHTVSKYAFNKIIIPTGLPVTNQNFKTHAEN